MPSAGHSLIGSHVNAYSHGIFLLAGLWVSFNQPLASNSSRALLINALLANPYFSGCERNTRNAPLLNFEYWRCTNTRSVRARSDRARYSGVSNTAFGKTMTG